MAELYCAGCGVPAGLPHHCIAIPWDNIGDEPVPAWVTLDEFNRCQAEGKIPLMDGGVFDAAAWDAAFDQRHRKGSE